MNDVTTNKGTKIALTNVFLAMAFFVTFLGIAVAVVAATSAQSQSPASPTKQSFIAPLSTTATNPCTGETIQLSGRFHVTITSVTRPNGSFHQTIVSNYQGVQGLGSDGNTYVVPSAGQNVMTSDDLKVSQTATYRELLISQGAADNRTVHGLLHITQDANGELRVEIQNLEIECQG